MPTSFSYSHHDTSATIIRLGASDAEIQELPSCSTRSSLRDFQVK
jgi:hypothetical protein